MDLPSIGKEPHAACGRDQLFEALGFGPGHLAAEGGEPVRPPPLVAIVFGG
jgi:hypothetical protein